MLIYSAVLSIYLILLFGNIFKKEGGDRRFPGLNPKGATSVLYAKCRLSAIDQDIGFFFRESDGPNLYTSATSKDLLALSKTCISSSVFITSSGGNPDAY